MAGGFRVSMDRVWIALILLPLAVTPVQATNLVITPTFDSSITSDPNKAAIENTINSAIAIYEATFSNPIDVSIDFKETTSGLGSNQSTLYTINYSTFYTAYKANAISHNETAFLASVPSGSVNPVTSDGSIDIKTADLRALGIPGSFPPIGGFDGIISLNTSITTPGSPGSSGSYSLMATVEHEMDEVLGLGSSLPSFTEPSVEDLFRYDASGHRSFTTNSSASAYFSINGTTLLAQFDNQNDGGDFGDWQSNPLPPGAPIRVQDAFATAGSNPTLGLEILALESVGYDEIAPEPGTVSLFLVSLPVFALLTRQRARTKRHSIQ
jgi:hypothetical protein